jgi:hypothetical protein
LTFYGTLSSRDYHNEKMARVIFRPGFTRVIFSRISGNRSKFVREIVNVLDGNELDGRVTF